MAISLMFLTLLILTPLSLLLILNIKQRISKPKYNLPPNPNKLPIVGNLHQLGILAHRSLWFLSLKYGPLIHLQLGSIPTIVISSPNLAKEILKTNDLDFCSRPQLFASKRYSYNCKDISFSPYGEYWREIRKICIIELFSVRKVNSFQSIREEEVFSMVETITRLCSSDVPINLTELAITLANNIVCRVGFGKRFVEREGNSSRLCEIMVEVQNLIGAFYFADYFPAMRWLDRLTGAAGRLERNVRVLDEFYERVIAEHCDSKQERREKEDIVDVLLRIQKEESYLTTDHVKAILTDVFLAGTETTSATITWAMAELIRNPQTMKKAQSEIRTLIRKNPKTKKVHESDLPNLQYLKSIVKETLRLHSPAPLLLPRESIRQTRIDGYDVPPGTRVFINAWAIGRDPNYWENPEEFAPERFLKSRIDYKGQDFELIPFGSGRRVCPAVQLACTMIELALANLLCCFDWYVPDGMERDEICMDEAPGIVVQMKKVLKLVAIEYV